MNQYNLNGSNLTFEQDNRITFIEESHRYNVEGIGDMTPVSSVIEKFFKPFDAEYWSRRKCYGDEIAAAKLREEWRAKGAFASQAGTFLHKQIENYIKEKIHPQTLDCTVSFNGDYVNRQQLVNIAKEWDYFLQFDKETNYSPFRTEWCVYNEKSRIAGTIDLLCCCPDGSYEIYDWKRSNRIDPNESNQWASGINGLEHLTDTAYSHYCLQQNLYRYMLETDYGITISRMNLVSLHPDLPGYNIIPIPRMEKEVEIILAQLPTLR